VTWFDILLAARYRGSASDALLDAAVKRKLITVEEANIIKVIPNGGFPAETLQKSEDAGTVTTNTEVA
jgi:hypothetical protein